MIKAKSNKNPAVKGESFHHDTILELRSLIDGQEFERQRLSRELHDGIGQSLIAIKLELDSLSYLEGDPYREKFRQIQEQFNMVIDEIRRISTDLMPAVLDEFGLVIALRNLCHGISEQARMKIVFSATGNLEELGKQRKTYIYRIVQEGLNNIVKHASATEVEITVTRKNDEIGLQITDNGRGFDPGKPVSESGHGLQNIRDRVRLMKGTLEIRSEQGKGTSIRARIPFYS